MLTQVTIITASEANPINARPKQSPQTEYPNYCHTLYSASYNEYLLHMHYRKRTLHCEYPITTCPGRSVGRSVETGGSRSVTFGGHYADATLRRRRRRRRRRHFFRAKNDGGGNDPELCCVAGGNVCIWNRASLKTSLKRGICRQAGAK